MKKNQLEKDLKFGAEFVSLAIPILKTEFEFDSFDRLDSGADADRKLSIDCKMVFSDRDETWAFKGRRPEYLEFAGEPDVTVEVMNGNGEKGDYYRFKGGVVRR